MVFITNISSSGAGSLRGVLSSATNGEIVEFHSSLEGQTVILSNSIEINKNITIKGNGVIVSGNNACRVFQIVDGGFEVTFQDLTIANGKTPDSTDTELTSAGGGILAGTGTNLTLENCQIKNNVAGYGGGIYTGFQGTTIITGCTFENNDGTKNPDGERGGGAIATKSAGSLTVKNSTFTNNKGTNGGAINLLLSSMTVENCTFTGNTSTAGSGINTQGYGGAIYTDGANASGANFLPGETGGTITLKNNKFEGNSGKGQGGALFIFMYPPDNLIIEKCFLNNNQVFKASNGDAFGGGLRIGNGAYTISRSTFANNLSESQGGGLWVGETSPGTIVNCTFAGNNAIDPDDQASGLGGGLMFATPSLQKIINTTIAMNTAGNEAGGIRGGRNITLINTIVAENTANNPYGNKQNAADGEGFAANPSPYFSNGGGNLQWPALTNNFNNANITDAVLQANPKLGALQDNGGGIPTMALLQGSAAINAGVTQEAPMIDQRGVTRTQPDIGSFEFAVLATPVIDHISPTSGGSSTEISISGSGFVPESVAILDSKEIPTQYISESLLKASVPS